jgi:hypothetical protein
VPLLLIIVMISPYQHAAPYCASYLIYQPIYLFTRHQFWSDMQSSRMLTHNCNPGSKRHFMFYMIDLINPRLSNIHFSITVLPIHICIKDKNYPFTYIYFKFQICCQYLLILICDRWVQEANLSNNGRIINKKDDIPDTLKSSSGCLHFASTINYMYKSLKEKTQ